MKRYAANRIYDVSTQLMHRNYVVEVDDDLHHVVQIFELDGEIRQTQWLGGLIILCADYPTIQVGEDFLTFISRIKSKKTESGILHAYHVTSFDLQTMNFTNGSRITALL